MIISHKYKFIFIKTAKTASTSIEIFLSQHCEKSDILTPIYPHIKPHFPRNYRGVFNPLSEIVVNRGRDITKTFKNFFSYNKFYNHIPAKLAKLRISSDIWNNYLKFCVERNPWDKTLSHYHMLNYRSKGKISLQKYFQNGNFCVNYPLYTDQKENLLVDRVLKYEKLIEELDKILSIIGIPFNGSLGINAKSECRQDRTSYQELFSLEQINIIERIFEREIKMHGFTF